ncbi:MAG: CapA family protein [Bacteroidota bacterium]
MMFYLKGFRFAGSLFFFLAFLSFRLAAQDSNLVSIIGVGDMMLGTNYPSRAYLPKDGGISIFKDVDDILRDADVTFGNLEGTLFDGEGEPKKCRDSSVCYLFRTPASYVRHFYDAGFDVLSIANNHSGDFGATGRKGTKRVLKNAGIHFAGLKGTDETAVFEKNGVKFGFCAFAPNGGTCDLRDIPSAKKIVASLDSICDIVIVSFHGGAEGPDAQHVPKENEECFGENRGDVHKFAHAVVDAGADVVFGHGPHVVRAVELYQDRFIAYSLGNFATYSRMNISGITGYAPMAKIITDTTGAFLEGEIISAIQVKWQGTKLDPQHRAAKKIQELTASDFPSGELEITAEGKLTRRQIASSK